MKRIKLTQGREAIVDDCDYQFLIQWNWYYCQGYARRTDNSRQRPVLMHQEIARQMGLCLTRGIDHHDTNSLNNRRKNLRLASVSQNQANQKLRNDNTSGFKGVSWKRQTQKWMAYININKKRHYLGYFDTKEEAAKAYNKAALEYFGEFSHLNTI